MDLYYFYSLTPREFTNILKGYREKEERNFKNGWIQTRKIMFSVLTPYSKKLNKETDLFEFDWEKEVTGELSDTEASRILEEFEKRKSFWDRYDEQQKKVS